MGLDRKRVFQELNDFWHVRGPIPLEVLFNKIDERLDNIGIVGDETLVEVDKAKKGLYIFNFG